MNGSTVWITWEEQRRNKPIAEEIGAKFFQISDTLKYSSLKRYGVNIWRTFNILRKEKPETVVVQNPSIVLSTLAIVLSWPFGYKIGIDTHNYGFGLKGDVKSKPMRVLSRWVQRTADFIIVHNDELKAHVENRGGNLIALPDKIPTIKSPSALKTLEGDMNFMFISSYAADEPWENVIEAFKLLGDRYHVYVTGNYKKVGIKPEEYPSNIHFMGRIPWDDFDQMLYSVDAILDLTTRDNCLLCGAYEAVACGTPLILSDTESLRNYFSKGCTYTSNTVESLMASVMEMDQTYDELRHDIVLLKPELESAWSQRVQHLKDNIQSAA